MSFGVRTTNFALLVAPPPILLGLHILALLPPGDRCRDAPRLFGSVDGHIALESVTALGPLLRSPVNLLLPPGRSCRQHRLLLGRSFQFAGFNGFFTTAANFSGAFPGTIADFVLSCPVLTDFAGAALALEFLPLSFTHSFNY